MNPESEKKSKSQSKREALALQKLGEQLVGLSQSEIDKIEMPKVLHEALCFAKTIKKHGALRRQMQYIGSLMRQIDPEPIQKAIVEISQRHFRRIRTLRQVELWRDNLMEGDSALFEEILDRFQIADRQRLSRLIRNARREKENNQTPKAYRSLLRYLRELITTTH
jgi:ribosome-associated protein